jgi:hypothetical protein
MTEWVRGSERDIETCYERGKFDAGRNISTTLICISQKRMDHVSYTCKCKQYAFGQWRLDSLPARE